LAAATLLAAGCAIGPGYERPTEVSAPVVNWRDTSLALRDSSYANVLWWNVFADTTLESLIRIALQENRDLHIALARVNEARALLGVQRLEFLPQLGVTGQGRTGEVGDSVLNTIAGPIGFSSVSIGLTWEIDLWGRVRRLNESARATLMASEQGRRGAIMTVVAEVARAYIELRDFDNQVAIAHRQVEIRQRSLDLARARFAGGLTSELDVRQGELALAGVEATQARLLRLQRLKENELSVLIGRPPSALPRGDTLGSQFVPQIVPAGLPSELLERRPDVRQAEEQVRAANARIGAAIGGLFPTISLTGAAGTASPELNGLFRGGASFWNLGANIFLPLLNRSNNLKTVAAERARTEAAVGQYEKVVLTAFQEVEDGLVSIQRLSEETQAAGRASLAAGQAVKLAELRYEGGVDNYLNLLDAQRSLLETELQVSSLMAEHRIAVVRLYKALGGGWDPHTDSLAVPRHKGGQQNPDSVAVLPKPDSAAAKPDSAMKKPF
jgi:multidrug efflux system outer membrane protein